MAFVFRIAKYTCYVVIHAFCDFEKTLFNSSHHNSMENVFFITVADSHNHYCDFEKLMQSTTDALRIDGKNRHDYYVSRTGESLESDVIECMKSKAADFRFNPELITHTPPQHFPDIISNRYFGVEVKSTKKNSWLSTGSSIVESLRDDDIKKIFMLFGILSRENVDFRCKPYEDCLYDIAVTHSPRYLINMDLKEDEETVFEKMNIAYDSFRKLGVNQIEKVREYYRKKYKHKDVKSLPWWIGSASDDAIFSENYELRIFSDLQEAEKQFFISRCYAVFPEILGKDQYKFRRPTLWLCSRHNIICSNIRDMFTAGGRGNIFIDNCLEWKNVPKVICNMIPCLPFIYEYFLSHASNSIDIENFSLFTSKDSVSFSDWAEVANRYINEIFPQGENSLSIEKLMRYRYLHQLTVSGKDHFYLSYEQEDY